MFSIIIPTYNNVELFRRALDSVLAQTYEDWEVIVSDDSSADGIEQLCHEVNDPRIRYVRRTAHDGAVKNWNHGLKLAKGENVIVIHHDEEFVSQVYLERLATLMDNNDLVISDIRVYSPGQPARRGRINGLFKRLMLRIPSSILNINPIGPCACLAFRREISQSFDEHLTWIVDTEWYYRMLTRAKHYTYAPDLLIRSNSGHADQITLNINIDEKNRQDTAYLNQKYKGNLGVRIALCMRKITSKLRKLIRR